MVRRLLIVTMSLVVFVVGCGGDEGASSTPSTPPAGAEATGVDGSSPGTSPTETGDEPAESPAAPTTFEGYLSAGDCFDDRLDQDGDIDFSGAPIIVDCQEPHDNEVVAIHVFEDEPGAPFPDDEQIWDPLFFDVCVPAFEDFLGISGAPSALDGYYLRPSEDEWDQGARTVPCVLYLPGARVQGTLQGVGNAVFPASFPSEAPVPDGITLSSAASIEDTYSPSDSFAADAGIDTDGFFGATFEGGDVDTVKSALESSFASSDWDVILEDQWSGGVATAFYALEREDSRLIVELWELEGGDARLHYFYRAP